MSDVLQTLFQKRDYWEKWLVVNKDRPLPKMIHSVEIWLDKIEYEIKEMMR